MVLTIRQKLWTLIPHFCIISHYYYLRGSGFRQIKLEGFSMKNFKKILAVGLVALFAIGMLAACGKSGGGVWGCVFVSGFPSVL